MNTIQAEIKAINNELKLFEDVMDKYEYIIELGKQLHPIEDKYKTISYKVQGCQSQIWLHPYIKENKVYFEAAGDALIAQGLVDILIRIYSGHSAQEILDTDSSSLKELHLSEIISSGRQNGIASMLTRIYGFAKETSTSQNAIASFTKELHNGNF
ncbi:SufE family protein [Sulfurimonas sp. MAG313]|nr:SufE family protein [Sulfurimonas sp. MAG313]MDF1881867.1 SufE family protein [Sulfurimonas sp. MAG313]